MAINLPFTFINGTVADATQVNANFTALASGGVPVTPPGVGLIVDQGVGIQPDAAPAERSASLGLNIYTDQSGQSRFIANGPGATLTTHEFAAGASVPGRLGIAISAANTAGPGALVGTALVGALNLVADTAGSGSAFVVIGSGNDVPPPTRFPRIGTLLATEVSLRPEAVTGNPDRVSRFGLNAYLDNSATPLWHYQADGPAANLTTHEFTLGTSTPGPAYIRVSVFEPGSAGALLNPSAVTTAMLIFSSSGTGANQTTMSLAFNSGAGTGAPVRVEVGPADSAGTGYRYLRVAN